MTDPRYPIGRPASLGPFSDAERLALIDKLERAPGLLRQAVEGLSDPQLDTPYRDGGWTLRQVVHHLADSHLNAYARFRLALTEDHPTIKAYEEKRWAELPDAARLPVAVSLQLLDALHLRLVALLRSLQPEDFARPFLHPESGAHDVDWLLAIYGWHGAHHIAHITSLRASQGW